MTYGGGGKVMGEIWRRWREVWKRYGEMGRYGKGGYEKRDAWIGMEEIWRYFKSVLLKMFLLNLESKSKEI